MVERAQRSVRTVIPPAMDDAPPFFIVGSPRSGTTLLRFMLSSHARLFVTDETGFLPFLRTDPDARLTRVEVRAVLDRIGRLNRFWSGMVRDVDAFCDALPEPRLRAVLDALYRIRIAAYGAVRWGDKTPLYVRYIADIDRLFPDARFVHVIRDGRDATLSALQKWGREKVYLDPYYLLKNWDRNVRAGQAAREMLGDGRYCEVRYEALVTRPEAVLREVCAFLGETFEPGMLDQTRLAALVGGGIDSHGEAQRPVTDARVGRWRTEMSSFQRKLADHLAGDTLEALGYPLSGAGPFTAAERLRLGALAAKFGLTDTTRTILYALGLLTLNRNRRR